MDRKLYDALQINQAATTTDVKRAYRRLALKYHPDKSAGHEAQVSVQAAPPHARQAPSHHTHGRPWDTSSFKKSRPPTKCLPM